MLDWLGILITGLAFALIAYVYLGYPALLYLLTRARRAGRDEPSSPTATIFIPAFNEEKVIAAKLANCLELDYPAEALEIVVASDGSTDRTVSIVRTFTQARIRLFHAPQRGGKNSVINQFLPRCSGEVVVFTDVNALFDRGAVRALVGHFGDPAVGCVVGNLVYTDQRSRAGQGEGLYFRYEAKLKELESRLGALVAATGSIYAIRRTLFEPLDLDVANDFAHPIQVQAKGLRIVFESGAVARERSTDSPGEEFDRKVRIVTRGLTAFSRYWKRYRMLRGTWGLCFVSHKLLRWLTPLYLAVALLGSAVLGRTHPPFLVLLLAQLAFYALALLGWLLPTRRLSILTAPFYFCVVNLAAAAAVLSFARGHRRAVWDPAASTR